MTDDSTAETDLREAQENLAFMRSLAQSAEQHNKPLGLGLFLAGVIYGVQTLVQWADAAGLISLSGPVHIGMAIAFSALFLAVLAYIIWRHRGTKMRSVASRAYEAAFAAAGLSNLAIVTVFIVASIRFGDAGIWYFYTPIVFAFQGAAWYIAARLREKLWLGLVAFGWFIAAVGLGLTTHSPTYVLVVAVALFLLLALPGYVIMRLAAREEKA
jgi:hypothetical protein